MAPPQENTQRVTRSQSVSIKSEPPVESPPGRKNANKVASNSQSKAPLKASEDAQFQASQRVTRSCSENEKRLASIESDFMREQEKNARLRNDRKDIWKAIDELESRIAVEQKTIFRLVHKDSERDRKTDVAEALEESLCVLHNMNYSLGGNIEKSAVRILGHMEQQVAVARKMTK